MELGDFKRRLTAILSADVVGYSRLMREDEDATIRAIKLFRGAITKLIKDFRGRVVDAPGDNILAEFTSVVDAVNCAVEIQRELAERNAELPENRRMEFRIGINMGDVVEEGDRLYGDGINIAARMESLAQAGGICISGTVYDGVEKKLGLEYEYLGEKEVKNIETPVRVYRVLSYPGAAAHRVIKAKKTVGVVWRNTVAFIAAILILGAAAVSIWHYYQRPAVPPVEVASVEKMAFPLPNKPSIAVLPFVNMSGDSEQEYFSDGLTDQIISTLSKLRNLFVIARNSSFTYKGKPVKVQKVAEDLGVQYILEGSVQKTTDRVRIVAQLIDATTGHHLWSERYDRTLEDIFALQDNITMEIAKALRIEITSGEQARLWQRRMTTNLEAFEKIMQGNSYHNRFSKADNARARQLFEEAIVLDSKSAGAYAMVGWTHFWDARFGWSESRAQSLKMAFECGQQSLALDDSVDFNHTLLAAIYLVEHQHEKAIAEAERALALNPNGALAYSTLAGVAGCSGRWEESIEYAKKSIRLEPFPPVVYFHWLGRAYFMTGRYGQAIETFKKALHVSPDYLPAHAFLAACYSSQNRNAEAAAETEEVLRLNFKFCLESYAKTLPYKNKADIDRYIEALRKAGLPETPPLSLPEKPSIAVLPFVNMSGDPEQEYFSDGISEEIINALSKTSHLFVIARESTFSYKGKQVKVQQIAHELGVRYILEGSVRKSEDRLRITAQLIDGIKGEHLWSERYDRDLKDIFALQDEIAMKIMTALQITLTEGEQARMWGKRCKNLDVYLKQMEALSLWRQGTPESHMRQGQVGQEIIDMAPDYGGGYRTLGWYYWYLAMIGKSPRESIGKAFTMAQKALSLDESDAYSHATLGSIYLMMRQYEKAIAEGERSVELDPNGAMLHGLLGMTLSYAGRPDEAIVYLNQGIRLNPFPAYWYFLRLGQSYRQKGQYEEALTAYKKALQRAPNAGATHVHLAVIYVLLDRHEEAGAAAKKVLELYPNFSVELASKTWPYKNQADLKLYVDALHKAGLK